MHLLVLSFILMEMNLFDKSIVYAKYLLLTSQLLIPPNKKEYNSLLRKFKYLRNKSWHQEACEIIDYTSYRSSSLS